MTRFKASFPVEFTIYDRQLKCFHKVVFRTSDEARVIEDCDRPSERTSFEYEFTAKKPLMTKASAISLLETHFQIREEQAELRTEAGESK